MLEEKIRTALKLLGYRDEDINVLLQIAEEHLPILWQLGREQ